MAKTKTATTRMFPGDYHDLLRALKRPPTRIIADLREVHQPCSMADAIVDVMHPGEWRAWWNRVRSRFAIADFRAIELGTAPPQNIHNTGEHREGSVSAIRIRRRRRHNGSTHRQLQVSSS